MFALMLRALEIPREHWSRFLRTFNRLVADQMIRLEVVGRQLGDQEMTERLPFHGIDYDSKGSERGSLTVSVGGSEGELSHRVIGPKRLYLGDRDGRIEWLAIEEAGEVGDVRTLIHFEPLPELEAEYLGEERSPV